MALENVEDLFDVQVSPDTFWRSQNVQQTFRCACYQDKLERMIFFSFISLCICFLWLLWKIYHNPSGLKEHKYIFLVICKSEVSKSVFRKDRISFGESKENPSPCF